MSEVIIYHNGRCSKSRGALEILQEKGIPHTVRWYMADPLLIDELKVLLKQLGMKASEMVRTNEPYYKEHLKDRKLTEKEWLPIMVEHPQLIERPIVVKDGKAVIARPAERVFEIL